MYGTNNGNYIELTGGKVYYEEYGQGETVLLLHGGPGSISNFSKLIPKLSQSFKVLAMDTPGQGRSERIDSMSYQILAENASGFIDKMGIPKCHIIGWSDGACTGLLLAADRPDVISKVFVSGAFSHLDGFTEEAKDFWSKLTPEMVEQSWGGWHLDYQKKYPHLDWKTLIYDLRRMIEDQNYITDEKLKSIESKVLLAYGDRDMFTMEHINYLHKTIRGSELMILPGAGHSTFDEQPDLMYLVIKTFLDN